LAKGEAAKYAKSGKRTLRRKKDNAGSRGGRGECRARKRENVV